MKKLSQTLYQSIQEYIEKNFADEIAPLLYNEEEIFYEAPCFLKNSEELLEALIDIDDSFSVALLKLIAKSGKAEVEVYKKANVDRKLFSKIKSNLDYKPSKTTVLSFCIALELSLDNALDLLETAGFTLSHSSKSDIIIEYFINHQNYNIDEINQALFQFELPLLRI